MGEGGEARLSEARTFTAAASRVHVCICTCVHVSMSAGKHVCVMYCMNVATKSTVTHLRHSSCKSDTPSTPAMGDVRAGTHTGDSRHTMATRKHKRSGA